MSSERRNNAWIWAPLILVLIVAAGFITWRWWPRSAPNMAEAMHANNQGVGFAERFQWPEAVTAFEEVVKLAPEWLPGRINLGIALLNNTDAPGALGKARALFDQLVQQQPENPYAHFCLGIIIRHEGKPEEMEAAAAHFKTVTRLDPNDAAAWYWYGSTLPERSPEQNESYERALQLKPSLGGAIYGLAMNLRQQNRERSEKLLDEFKALQSADWLDATQIKYTEMGHYAEVIGTPPASLSGSQGGSLPSFEWKGPRIDLASGARWAAAADLGTGPVADLRRQLRKRFGGVMVVLDYNRDGKPDLLLLAAVVEGGQVRDLLLRNEGNAHFVDVTAQAGLAGLHHSVGCCVADYDNDGYPDLCITGIGEQRLFRNTGKGTFEDVTARAGLDKLTTVCLGATFVDLDQDGDLDLVIAQYATPETALSSLKGQAQEGGPGLQEGGPGLAVFLNIGEALPTTEKAPSPALTTKFKRLMEPVALLGAAVSAVNLVVADFDRDRDLDLLVLADHRPPGMVVNDRLLRFHRADLPLEPRGTWNGGLVLDIDHDERSDVLLIGPGHAPLMLVNRSALAPTDAAQWFRRDTLNSPPLIQAHAVDIDLDGWTDIVGLSEEGQPILLRNIGGRLDHARPPGLFNAGDENIGITLFDVDGDGLPDILLWSDSTKPWSAPAGLKLFVSQGNGNHGLKLELSGHRRTDGGGNKLRCNGDGFGAWVMAQAYDVGTAVENTTLSAGLGQSRQPLLLGLGPHNQADVLRLRWPDNTWQAEFNLSTKQLASIEETNRRTGSCPVLFAWDGRRFGFVTDFLGGGSLGEGQPDGSCRLPRPEESIKIEADQLLPLDGSYVLKIAEPMDEVTYLDRLQLLVLDHPNKVRVYPDERFSTDGTLPSQDLLALREEIFPLRARDHRGRDVTRTLQAWDRQTVDGFARRSWLGYAENHWVELAFGNRLAKFKANDPLILCLAGWTDYAYPESIWAATQAGVGLQAPVLERLDADGTWRTLMADVGFPAGLPRMMTVEMTGKLGGPGCVLRLRTNMEIYWDKIFVAPLAQRLPAGQEQKAKETTLRVLPLEVQSASLAARGFLREYSPDGRPPYLYDYQRLESVPFSQLGGRLTRFGDVTELLRDRDDRFVIFGPGDEVTVRFDAGNLPALPQGWTRSFVLRTWGYCKDCGPFTATGATIEPLPFRAMSNYPYGPDEHYPRDADHEDYRKRFNTRPMAGVSQRKP